MAWLRIQTIPAHPSIAPPRPFCGPPGSALWSSPPFWPCSQRSIVCGCSTWPENPISGWTSVSNERMRLARDLHDTLLQSFQGALLKLHAVTYRLPDHLEAKKELEAAIGLAREAITEGRDAVQGLRSSTMATKDLVSAVTTLVEALASDQNGGRPAFRVVVEGKSRDLAPLVRDEIYRIAGEALRNAFRHADAPRIDVDIHYDTRQFQIRVRDFGKGIDPSIVNAGGRGGHYGLPGIRERAELVGGKFAVWSEFNFGTAIALTVPASIAYTKSCGGAPVDVCKKRSRRKP